MGRPPFKPTDQQRKDVESLSGLGVTHEAISKHIGVDGKTLRLHFRDELDAGALKATAQVAKSLFHMATVDKNVTAAIFWMKARANWSEKVRQEVTGAEGGPVEVKSDLAKKLIDAITTKARNGDA